VPGVRVQQRGINGGDVIRVLDLFAGLRGWSDTFAERGHDVRTLDYDDRFDVTYLIDIHDWDAERELRGWRPDIILASPDCTGFTVMTIGRNWTRPTDDPPNAPKTEQAVRSLRLVERTREVIALLQPRYFVIENPVDKLRVLPVVADLERRSIWYCHYGETHAKPTDLWGGFPESFVAEPPCHQRRANHPLDPDCCCLDHAQAPRGSRTPGSVQGYKGKDADAVRSKIPEMLALSMCVAAETDLGLEPWSATDAVPISSKAGSTTAPSSESPSLSSPPAEEAYCFCGHGPGVHDADGCSECALAIGHDVPWRHLYEEAV